VRTNCIALPNVKRLTAIGGATRIQRTSLKIHGFAATGIAAPVAADQASKRGKTYFVSVGVEPRAVYIFACDHPDARNPAIHAALEITPTGERIRRTISRH
jgi:hypothetical protein